MMNSIKYYFALIVALFIVPFQVNAQLQIITSDTTICTNTPINLQAQVSGASSTSLALTDDLFTGVIPLGFSFNFFGNNYSSCVISSNGYLSFDLSNAGQFSPWQINSGIPGNTTNGNYQLSTVAPAIMGFYADILPMTGQGTLDYTTIGTAPNRKFVMNLCDVPMFSCTSLLTSFQIILYETTNEIEVHIGNAPNCSSWNNGYAIEGIQNSTGTTAFVVPGRNFPNLWTAYHSSHRFTPTGTNSYTITAIPYAPVPTTNSVISWYANGTTFINTGTSVTVSPTQSTFYVAEVVKCSDTLKDTVNVNVLPLSSSFNFTTHLGCLQDTVTFTNNSIGNTQNQWTFGDGSGNSFISPSHIYLNQGTYNVTLITSNAVCSDTSTQIVNTLHPLMSSFTVDKDSACAEQLFSFTNTSTTSSPSSYLWIFGDGIISTSPNTSHAYNIPGNYNVSLIVTDQIPCKDTMTKSLKVFGGPPAHIDVSSTSVCLGDPLSFQTNGVANYSHLIWGLGDGTTYTDVLSFDYTYTASGNYTVSLTTQYPICPDTTETVNISVHNKPILTTNSDTTVSYGDVIQLYASGADYYTWTPDKYLDFPNTNTPKYTAWDSTTLELIGMNTWGCKDTAFIHVGIDYNMFETIANAFTPNGDGRNDVFSIGHIKYQKIIEFKVFNRWGQMVYNDSVDNLGWDGTYNGTPAEAGVYNYLIRVVTPDGKQKVYKGNVSLIR